MDDVCICTMEPRPRVLGGPNGNLYGDEVLVPVEGSVSFWDHQTPGWNDLWGSNGGHLCALGALGTRETVEGPCATGRFRRHLDGFRHFTVHMNHNEVYIGVCEAKLRPWCNMYVM